MLVCGYLNLECVKYGDFIFLFSYLFGFWYSLGGRDGEFERRKKRGGWESVFI